MQEVVHARRRVARVQHDCTVNKSLYCTPIRPGDAYLELMEVPGQSVAARAAGRVLRNYECVYCSDIQGRHELVEPIPEGQPYKYWQTDSETPVHPLHIVQEYV